MITKTALVNRLHEKQMFDTEFKAFIKDQSISLEERWDLFKFACENSIFVNVNRWAKALKTLEAKPNFTWYDYFYVEKYQTVHFTRIVETIESHLKDIKEENNPEVCYEEIYPITTCEGLIELKEEILATGYSGFVYDW
jgi:hypothetical protein